MKQDEQQLAVKLAIRENVVELLSSSLDAMTVLNMIDSMSVSAEETLDVIADLLIDSACKILTKHFDKAWLPSAKQSYKSPTIAELASNWSTVKHAFVKPDAIILDPIPKDNWYRHVLQKNIQEARTKSTQLYFENLRKTRRDASNRVQLGLDLTNELVELTILGNYTCDRHLQFELVCQVEYNDPQQFVNEYEYYLKLEMSIDDYWSDVYVKSDYYPSFNASLFDYDHVYCIQQIRTFLIARKHLFKVIAFNGLNRELTSKLLSMSDNPVKLASTYENPHEEC